MLQLLLPYSSIYVFTEDFKSGLSCEHFSSDLLNSFFISVSPTKVLIVSILTLCLSLPQKVLVVSILFLFICLPQKVLIVGPYKSGKTSLVQTLVDQQPRMSEEIQDTSGGIDTYEVAFDLEEADALEGRPGKSLEVRVKFEEEAQCTQLHTYSWIVFRT